MRHLFNKWASYNQLMTTARSSNSLNSSPIVMSYQEVPIIEEEDEEEEFDVDNEGSFCLVSIDIG